MNSGEVLAISSADMEIISRIQLTSLFTGRSTVSMAGLPDIIQSVLYFAGHTARTVAGELNRLLNTASNAGGAVEGQFHYSPSQEDAGHLESITDWLRKSGLKNETDYSGIFSSIMHSIFRNDKFNGTVKKKYLDSVFVSAMYGVRPLSVLRMFNEPPSSDIPFTKNERDSLVHTEEDSRIYEEFRKKLYSPGGEGDAAKVILQRYTSAHTSGSGTSRDSITLTERSMQLSDFVSGMKSSRSTSSLFDFESAFLGYALHVLSWTDESANIPYVAKRLFSLSYEGSENAGASSQKGNEGYPYQKIVESFAEYRNAYSYGAWSLDSFLTGFYRICHSFRF